MNLDYPVALRLANIRVLLVGAGRVAVSRVERLLEAGADVRVVAPEVDPRIRALAAAERIDLVERAYRPGDCAGARLVFTAVNRREVTRRVASEARALGLWVNAADVPELCDFYLPAVGRRGPVTVAVSSAGQAPSLSRHLRDRLMATLGPDIGALARLIGTLRRTVPGGPARRALLETLLPLETHQP